jgi:excisionase family DNA binding protein
MTEMLTAKEMQDLLQVDRSTIYRMAEAGQLPAVKIGKQWRFPGGLVERWLKNQSAPVAQPAFSPNNHDDAGAVFPLDCIQLIQDAFAEVLGVMLVVTGLDGQPITQVSNAIPLYRLLAETEAGFAICHDKWRELGQVPALEPRFTPGFAGLLCARALVRMGNELKAMVVVFGVAPPAWPPAPETTRELAASLGVPIERLVQAFEDAPVLSEAEQKRVLVTTQRIADILAHIGNERLSLLDRLASIAKLSAM